MPGAVLSIADDALLALGATLTIGTLLFWAVRSRRDPLACAPDRVNRFLPEAVLLPMLVWMLAVSALGMAAERWLTGDLLDAAMIFSGNAAQLLGAVACLLVASRFFEGGAKRFLIGRSPVRRQLVSGLGYFLSSQAVCPAVLYATVALLTRIEPQYVFFQHDVIDALRGGKVALAALWIGTVLIAPVAEECFFRGVLQTTLENLLKSRWIALSLTAAIFGAIHAGGGDTPQPHVVPALTVLGVMLGVVYVRSGSLVAPIFLHALFNAKTLVWESLAQSGG